MTTSWTDHIGSFWRELFGHPELLAGLHEAMAAWCGLLWEEQAASNASDNLLTATDERTVAFWPMQVRLGDMRLGADGRWRWPLPAGVRDVELVANALQHADEMLERGLDFTLEEDPQTQEMWLVAEQHMLSRFSLRETVAGAPRVPLATCEEATVRWGLEDGHLKYVTDKLTALNTRAALRRELQLSGRMRSMRSVSVIGSSLLDPEQTLTSADVGRHVVALAPGASSARILACPSPGQALLDRSLDVTAAPVQLVQSPILHELFTGVAVSLQERTGALGYLTNVLRAVTGPLSATLDQPIPSPPTRAEVMFPVARSGQVLTIPSATTRAVPAQLGWWAHISDRAGNYVWAQVSATGGLTSSNRVTELTVVGDVSGLDTTQLALSLHRFARESVTFSFVAWSGTDAPATPVFLRGLRVRNRGLARWTWEDTATPYTADYLRAVAALLWAGPTQGNVARAMAAAAGLPMTRQPDEVVMRVVTLGGGVSRVVTSGGLYDLPTARLSPVVTEALATQTPLPQSTALGTVGRSYDGDDHISWAYGTYLPATAVALPREQRMVDPTIHARDLDGSWVLGEPGATWGGDAAGAPLEDHLLETRGVWAPSTNTLFVVDRLLPPLEGRTFYALGVAGTVRALVGDTSAEATWSPPLSWQDTYLLAASWTSALVTFARAVGSDALGPGDAVALSNGQNRLVLSRPSDTTALLQGTATAGSGTAVLPMDVTVVARPATRVSTGYSMMRRLLQHNIMGLRYDAAAGGAQAFALVRTHLNDARPAHAILLQEPLAIANDAAVSWDALAEVAATAVERAPASSPGLRLAEIATWDLDGYVEFPDHTRRARRRMEAAHLPADLSEVADWHLIDVQDAESIWLSALATLEESTPEPEVAVWERVASVWTARFDGALTATPLELAVSPGSDHLFALVQGSAAPSVPPAAPILLEHDGGGALVVVSTAGRFEGRCEVASGSDHLFDSELPFAPCDVGTEVVVTLTTPPRGWTLRVVEVLSASEVRLVDAWTNAPFAPGLTAHDCRVKMIAQRAWGQTPLHLNGMGSVVLAGGPGARVQELPLEVAIIEEP